MFWNCYTAGSAVLDNIEALAALCWIISKRWQRFVGLYRSADSAVLDYIEAVYSGACTSF